jgi:TorA maturation chaperone TorD
MAKGVTVKPKDRVKLSSYRSSVYGFLARVYQKELTPELLEHLRSPRFVGALEELGLQLGDEFTSAAPEELLEDLAVEYTGLFLGPGGHVSPHESVHRVGGKPTDVGVLWGAATVEVKKFVESLGLKYREDAHNIPDHISHEMELMQKVVERECEAWKKEDTGKALYCLKVEKMFLEGHLVKWIPAFTKKIIDLAERRFYREIAEVTRGFIEFEAENIDSYIAELQTASSNQALNFKEDPARRHGGRGS